MTVATRKRRAVRAAEPVKDWLYTWLQERTWSEEAYLSFADANRLCELSDGKVEVLEMPTPEHQWIVSELAARFKTWLSERQAGQMLFAPVPIRLWAGKFREPDIVVYLTEHLDRIGKTFGRVPDLVVEVLSPGTRDLDLTKKFREYAQAGVSEYWLVDPSVRGIQVYTLQAGHYAPEGHFGAGQRARSLVLPGFEVAVEEIFPGAGEKK